MFDDGNCPAWNGALGPRDQFSSQKEELQAFLGSAKNRTTAAMVVLGSVIKDFRQTTAGLSEADEHVTLSLQQTGCRSQASNDVKRSSSILLQDRTLKLATVS